MKSKIHLRQSDVHIVVVRDGEAYSARVIAILYSGHRELEAKGHLAVHHRHQFMGERERSLNEEIVGNFSILISHLL